MTTSIKMFALLSLILTAALVGGCQSDSLMAPASSTPTVDTAPPVVPTGLAAAATGGSVKVTWDANVVDPDFLGFMVYRVVWGTYYPMLNLPQQENIWIDDHPVNVACTYAVTAVDNFGNESAVSAVNFLGHVRGPGLNQDF